MDDKWVIIASRAHARTFNINFYAPSTAVDEEHGLVAKYSCQMGYSLWHDTSTNIRAADCTVSEAQIGVPKKEFTFDLFIGMYLHLSDQTN